MFADIGMMFVTGSTSSKTLSRTGHLREQKQRRDLKARLTFWSPRSSPLPITYIYIRVNPLGLFLFSEFYVFCHYRFSFPFPVFLVSMRGGIEEASLSGIKCVGTYFFFEGGEGC